MKTGMATALAMAALGLGGRALLLKGRSGQAVQRPRLLEAPSPSEPFPPEGQDATAEIARAISAASASSANASHNVRQVAAVIDQTSSEAGRVSNATGQLSASAKRLAEAVDWLPTPARVSVAGKALLLAVPPASVTFTLGAALVIENVRLVVPLV